MMRNSVWILLPILIHALSIQIAAAAETDYCYDTQSDFAQVCTDFDGVIDGPRCFFALTQQVKSWEEAWAACKANGAALAQFHTLSEFTKFKTLMKDKYPKYGGTTTCAHCNIIMAYCDKTGVASKAVCPTTGNAHWYDDVDTYQPLLNIKNSLSKYYDCKDSNLQASGPRCYAPSYWDEGCEIGYESCGYWYPACVVSNSIQTYTLTTYCLTETVIESVAGQDVQACTNECRARSGWCRSFNVVANPDGTMRCDLFSRSIKDCDTDAAKCPSKIVNTATCVHYNYEL